MVDAFKSGRYKAFEAAAKSADPTAVAAFYYKTGVLVNSGEGTAVVGRDAIAEQYKKFNELFGKATDMQTSNENFAAAGDFIVATGTFTGNSEKLGPLKGDFTQVWKKDGGEYFIYHDEFIVAK